MPVCSADIRENHCEFDCAGPVKVPRFQTTRVAAFWPDWHDHRSIKRISK
jgi:hypothetical protein